MAGFQNYATVIAPSKRGRPAKYRFELGQRLDHWTVVEGHRGRWLVRCDCGVERIYNGAALNDGKASCGTCSASRCEKLGPSKASSAASVAARALRVLRATAPKRGLVVTVTVEDMVALFTEIRCTFCTDFIHDNQVGLDRIDNRRGYEPGNLLRCCSSCNVARGRLLTVDEMRAAMAVRRAALQPSEASWGSGTHPAWNSSRQGSHRWRRRQPR